MTNTSQAARLSSLLATHDPDWRYAVIDKGDEYQVVLQDTCIGFGDTPERAVEHAISEVSLWIA